MTSSPPKASSDPTSASSRGTPHRPSALLHVDSIQEDEEESATKTPSPVSQNRIRHGSLGSPAGSAQVGGRVRSMSADPSILAQGPALAPPQANLTPNNLIQKRRALPGQDLHLARPRKSQPNEESMGLDDIMAGSDEDVSLFGTPKSKRIRTLSRPGQPSVSAGTRELMDFLAEGPPQAVPAPTSQRSVENGRSKGSGRLQRMISKLSLGNGDRSKSASDELSKSKSTSTRQIKPSPSTVSLLANRPIPPRFLPSGSPDSPSRDASQEAIYSSLRSCSGSLSQTKPKSAETQSRESPPPLPRDCAETSPTSQQAASVSNGHVNQVENGSEEVVSAPTALPHAAYTVDKVASDSLPPSEDLPTQSRNPTQVGSQESQPTLECNTNLPHISGDDAKKLRGLLSHATTADECRLLLDMFLVKSGISSVSPPTPVMPRAEVIPVDAIENSIVELLL